MAHTFSYMFAKNLCKRALLVQITRLVDIVNSAEFTISTKRIELNYYRIKVKGHVQFCNAVTMATHKSPKLHQRQIVQKSCWPPILRPLKISPPKVDKPTYGTELYHHANLHADRRGISVRGKNTYFPYRGLPWGATVPCYTFLESSCQANVTTHLTCFRDIRGQNLVVCGPLGVPPREDRDLLSFQISRRLFSPSPRYL